VSTRTYLAHVDVDGTIVGTTDSQRGAGALAVLLVHFNGHGISCRHSTSSSHSALVDVAAEVIGRHVCERRVALREPDTDLTVNSLSGHAHIALAKVWRLILSTLTRVSRGHPISRKTILLPIHPHLLKRSMTSHLLGRQSSNSCEESLFHAREACVGTM
jgi:hypothetical protein